MKERCRTCNAEIIRFPLWKGEGESRKFLWGNLFKMSLDSIVLLLLLVGLIMAYKSDTKKCFEIVENPVGYCRNSGACSIVAQEDLRYIQTKLYEPDTFNISIKPNK